MSTVIDTPTYSPTEAPTYGGWRRTRGIGLFGLGSGGTIVVLCVVAVQLTLAAINFVLFLYGLAPAIFVITVTALRWQGETLWDRTLRRCRWTWGSMRGYRNLRGGVLIDHDSAWNLPGVLGPTRVIEVDDGRGVPFGIVHDQRTGLLTPTLHCDARSTWLVDGPQADGWVANWHSWLADLGVMPMVAWVAVTIETAPEPGSTLAQQVASRIDPNSPADARALLAELVARSPAAAADVDTRVSITFDPKRSIDRLGDLADQVAEVSRILVGMESALAECGVSVLGRSSAAELAGIMRTAYDPLQRGEVNALLARDREGAEQLLRWGEAGPVSHDEEWGEYRHDSGLSVSWAWQEAPRQQVNSNVLAPLLSPGRWPRRVTLLFRSLSAEAAARELENEVNAADIRRKVREKQGRDETARDATDDRRARQAAHEEAIGAGVVRTSLYVTVTVTDAGDLPTACADIESRAARAKIRLRRLYASQAAGFAVTLPAGIHPARGEPRPAMTRRKRSEPGRAIPPESPERSLGLGFEWSPPSSNGNGNGHHGGLNGHHGDDGGLLVAVEDRVVVVAPVAETAAPPKASRRQRRKVAQKARWAANRAANESGTADEGSPETKAPAARAAKPVSKAKQVKQARAAIAPAWGWREAGRGRASHVAAGPEYQGTTTQVCGLYPFLAGSGSPSVGVPIGRHLLWGEVVCLDQFGWLGAGLVTNPGIFVLGQPGTGKSSLIKRLMRGMAGFGIRPFVLGDLKPDYTQVVERLGGQVIRIGRGLDKINPLDTGPLGQAAARMSGPAAERLRAESRGRRLNALLALLTLVRRYPLTNGEENVLAEVIDLLDQKGRTRRTRTAIAEPTVPDVLAVLRGESNIDRLIAAADAADVDEFRRDTKELRQTLNLLCSGSLKGVFDGPTTRPIDLDAPAVSVDISQVSAAGDTLVAAAMLSTWAYGFAMIDGAAALADEGLAPRRQFLAVRDELWRALRGSPGLVEHADALTRVNRAKGVADITATHSLADLEALATEEDRAKARGFIERAGVTILAGLPPRELYQVAEVVSLSAEERAMVSGWSAPASWVATEKHPGRGKYLLKSGQRVGIPVELEYVGDEAALYDTDGRMLVAAAEAAGVHSDVVVGS